jgi:hypothetical protein
VDGELSHTYVSREAADLFLRGHERAPSFGPPLRELSHTYRPKAGFDRHRGRQIESTGDARVVRSKLILHSVHELCISFFPLDPHTSGIRLDKLVVGKLLPEISKFETIECSHLCSRGRIRLPPSSWTRSSIAWVAWAKGQVDVEIC